LLQRYSYCRFSLLALLLAANAQPGLAQSEPPNDEVTREVLRFTQVYATIQDNFMDPLEPEQAIYNGGIRGALSELDPFSNFFDPDQLEQLKQFTVGKSKGFGTILYVQTGKVLILQSAEGSPARRAGLGPGDEIVSVNGTRVERLDLQSLVELLQRSRSKKAQLGVIRPGKVVAEDFELLPAEIPNPSADKSFAVAPGVGYLHVNAFDLKTPQEIAEAVQKLGGASLQGLVIDLRDNRGGVLDAATAAASLFLPPDLLVLTQRGRAMPEQSFKTYAAPAHFDTPLVLLVNGTTASAAEVFVAALQEHDRALVAGEPTFGKGVVESVVELGQHTGLALTTAQYFTPSGRSIQRPLAGTALADPESGLRAGAERKYQTANGRPLAHGGGILPDVELASQARDPWVTFINQRGLFTSFASEYLTTHGRINDKFVPDDAALDAFRDFLARQRIQTPEEYWQPDREYMKMRIRAEIFNLVFGLEVGEQIVTRDDPQVSRALELLPQINALLKPHTAPALAIAPK
jgi:carboxyl-terminal processing protease